MSDTIDYGNGVRRGKPAAPARPLTDEQRALFAEHMADLHEIATAEEAAHGESPGD